MKKLKYIIPIVLGFFGFTALVFGNSSYFAPTASSATATTTVQFLTAGSSTVSTSTPVVYDSYGINGTNQNSGQKSDTTDSVALMEYVNASTTSTSYRTFIEYSDGIAPSGNPVNCATNQNACDWYDNNLETYAAGNIAIAVPNTYSYVYASTTHDTTQSAPGTTENRGSKLIGVKVPLRYVRAYVVVSGANGSVFLKFVPKKQQM